jgi:hypothetical protein
MHGEFTKHNLQGTYKKIGSLHAQMDHEDVSKNDATMARLTASGPSLGKTTTNRQIRNGSWAWGREHFVSLPSAEWWE